MPLEHVLELVPMEEARQCNLFRQGNESFAEARGELPEELEEVGALFQG